jgi:hypothetical protein
MTRTQTATVVAVAVSTVAACGGAPTMATDAMTKATIESVVTSFRGTAVESAPVTIPSPEVLDVETRLTLQVPAEARVTLYLCVLETSSSIGVGECVGLSTTAGDLQQRGDVVRMGIRTFKTDMPRTTNFVYLGFVEGAFPWVPAGSPPRVGDTFGGNRVLATMQLARTVTFQ